MKKVEGEQNRTDTRRKTEKKWGGKKVRFRKAVITSLPSDTV